MNRRQFVSTMTCAAATASMQAAGRRPNIVIIMADDMGFSDVGCYGGEIETPNLDALAKSGVRFTQFYNNAKCCPTRASLLTGLYNHQVGVGRMVENMGVPSYQGYLNDRCVTVAEALREGGYKTLMAGKWHIGEDKPHWPKDRGFDRYFGLISGSSNYYRVTELRPLVIEDKVYRPKDDSFYMTDIFTDYAVKYLDEYARGPQPFFLYTAYTSPHWPLHAAPETVAKYRGKYMLGWDELRKRRHARQLEMGIVDKRWPLTARDDEAPAWDSLSAKQKEEFDLKMAVYAAQIDCMDQNIGRILKKIKETGQEENTLVLFLADNGGCSVEVDRGTKGVPPGGPDSFLAYGLPWANASNTPFRLFKSWVHEGGISTPLIARGPGVVKGSLTAQPGHIMDIMPTCLDLAGVPYPKSYKGRNILPTEGRTLMPVLQGKKREAPPLLCWEHLGNRAVRQGRWKLVSSNRSQWELYDVEADRTEMNNLAGSNPEKVKELEALYSTWAKRCGVLKPEELKRKKA